MSHTASCSPTAHLLTLTYLDTITGTSRVQGQVGREERGVWVVGGGGTFEDREMYYMYKKRNAPDIGFIVRLGRCQQYTW